jgi:hypothetical protein
MEGLLSGNDLGIIKCDTTVGGNVTMLEYQNGYDFQKPEQSREKYQR